MCVLPQPLRCRALWRLAIRRPARSRRWRYGRRTCEKSAPQRDFLRSLAVRQGEIVGRAGLSDNARLPQPVVSGCIIPGRGDGIGRRSGLKHRRRKAWGFDFPPRHQQPASESSQSGQAQPPAWWKIGANPDYTLP